MRPDLQYDAVSGISAGAINAGLFAIYEKGQERQLADDMVSTWESLTNGQVKQKWNWLGLVTSPFMQQGFYDDTPLLEFV